jgi:hypothetical protein
MDQYLEQLQREAQEILKDPEKVLQAPLTPLELSEGSVPLVPCEQESKIDGIPVGVASHLVGEDTLLSPQFAWFTAAPLYACAGIPFDLVEQFTRTPEGRGAQVVRVRLSTSILPAIKGWENIVEGIDVDHWDLFVTFMSTCAFTKGGKKFRVHDTRINNAMHHKSRPVDITVFLASDGTRILYAYRTASGISLYAAEIKGDKQS